MLSVSEAVGLFGNFPITDTFTGTQPVTAQDAFDSARLAAWKQAHVADFSSVLQVEQFKGGRSDPTCLLRDARRKQVLRRKPTGRLLPSAHAADREYRVISALADSEVPAPSAKALCEDDSAPSKEPALSLLAHGRIRE